MNRLICFFGTLSLIAYSITANATPLNPSDLVKVTPNNNVKCVDYYSYKKELYCTTTHHPEAVDPEVKSYERLNIVFDDRPWKIGWGKKEADSTTTVEYVPMNEDIENWNELITSQFFPDLQEKVTPKQFAELFGQRLKESGYKPIITFLKDSPDQVIVELRIAEPKNQAQDEMQMITADNKGIYMLHYVVKQADMGAENRKKWFENLKNSTIKLK